MSCAKLFLWNFKTNPVEIPKNFTQELSPVDLEKLTNIKDPERKASFLATRYLLKLVLLKVNPSLSISDLKFSQCSKPLLSKIHLSWSHSGDWVGILCSADSCGFDLETKNQINFSVAKKYFHEKEIKIINDSPSMKRQYFLKLWSLKEAAYKCLDQNFETKLSQFYFDLEKQELISQPVARELSYHSSFFQNMSLACCFSKTKASIESELYKADSWENIGLDWTHFHQRKA